MTNSFYDWMLVYGANSDVRYMLDDIIIYNEKYNIYDIKPNRIIRGSCITSFKSNNSCAVNAHELMDLIKSVFIIHNVGYYISAIKYYEAESESIFSESSPYSGDNVWI